MAREVTLRAEAVKLFTFIRRQPSQNVSNVGHDWSLRAKCLKE
jgi:hypothetical protein